MRRWYIRRETGAGPQPSCSSMLSACVRRCATWRSASPPTVTPCWCYGSETMEMDPLMPKAVWGFNGTERPGAVYLAARADDQDGQTAQ